MNNSSLDGLFMTAVQQSQGIDNFFDNLFGFFGRKTDFFTKEEQAMTTVNQHLTRHIQSFKADKEKKEKLEKAKKAAAEKTAAERAAKEAEKKAAEDSQTMEVSAEEAAAIEAAEAAKKSGAQPAAASATEENKEEGKTGEEEKKDDAEEGELPNAANGGQTDKYQWEQVLQEVTVNIFIPEGTTSKMLNVDIKKESITVGIKGQDPILDGKLCKEIKKGDSIWCIETRKDGQRILQLSLTKKDQQAWWNYVVEGDAKINTQKIEPENSKLSDLDGETRGVVEKMMFDQQQKQKGLPTADEQQKKDQLAKFMAAHPEMDFSNAKFS